jgi:hypothetical protein
VDSFCIGLVGVVGSGVVGSGAVGSGVVGPAREPARRKVSGQHHCDQQYEHADHDLGLGAIGIRNAEKPMMKHEQHGKSHADTHRKTTGYEREQLQHRPWPAQHERYQTDPDGFEVHRHGEYQHAGPHR